MSYLNKMYNSTPSIQSNKNPNRVLGGLKGAGVDTYTMLGEDGLQKEVPTLAYVRGLEEKLKKLEKIIIEQDKKIRRLTNVSNNQSVAISAISRTNNT